MGWSSATEYVDTAWNLFEKYVPVKDRPSLAAKLVLKFEEGDWDTQDECSSGVMQYALESDDYLLDAARYWRFDDWEAAKASVEYVATSWDLNISDERMARLKKLYEKNNT